MREIISKYNEFQKQLVTLKDYLLFNKDKEEAKYSEYRDIVYGAIINRLYTLWETYVKDIFYEYFKLKKEEYYRNNMVVEKYRINELPGYLFEEALFNRNDESIMFKLNKDILCFTSKNMDMKEMCKLFKRIDLDVKNKLDSDSELKDAVQLFEVAFEDGLLNDNKPTQGLKRIIQERNLVSHYANIDSFQNLDILLQWVNFYKLLGKTLCKIICLEYTKTIDSSRKIIGECKKAYPSNNILLIDIGSEIKLDKTSLLYVYSDEALVDIMTPVSFQVENVSVEMVQANSKAGIQVKTIFDYETKVKKEYKYHVIEEVSV